MIKRSPRTKDIRKGYYPEKRIVSQVYGNRSLSVSADAKLKDGKTYILLSSKWRIRIPAKCLGQKIETKR